MQTDQSLCLSPEYSMNVKLLTEHHYPQAFFKTRGPLVFHLRMPVYKGIGKHRSFQSPAMNFDRSAISLRLNMGYLDKMIRM